MSDRMTHGIPARFSHFMNTYVEHAEISIYELPPNATSLENAVGLSDMSASVDMSLRGMLEEAAKHCGATPSKVVAVHVFIQDDIGKGQSKGQSKGGKGPGKDGDQKDDKDKDQGKDDKDNEKGDRSSSSSDSGATGVTMDF
eukprot:s3923_g2.t1